MPWCEDCAKYYAPSAMSESGECPTCGRPLEAPRVTSKTLNLKRLASGRTDARAHLNGDVEGDDDDEAGAPWHFKLLMVLMVLYFIWRIVQLFR